MDSMAWAWLAERQLLVAWHHSDIVASWVSDTNNFIAAGDFLIFEFGHTDFCTGCAVPAAARFTAFRLLVS